MYIHTFGRHFLRDSHPKTSVSRLTDYLQRRPAFRVSSDVFLRISRLNVSQPSQVAPFNVVHSIVHHTPGCQLHTATHIHVSLSALRRLRIVRQAKQLRKKTNPYVLCTPDTNIWGPQLPLHQNGYCLLVQIPGHSRRSPEARPQTEVLRLKGRTDGKDVVLM